MKSPADMKVIQIDITNACHKACSNCTRFCGEHPKPFFMNVESFKKAVDSMEGFPGIVGIMGGEPTLHPQFPEMMDYYASRIAEPRPGAFIGTPTPDFKEYGGMVKYMRGRKRGLWSSLGAGYYRNFEQIQDVFPYQNLNDHQSVNTHQAILVTRKELGIPDEEWFKLRDNCWIQNIWSASITPKGAFFCEIAAALDILFDGPGGWPLEPGWWKRKPSDFGEQLNWCEMCSVALKVPTMNANEDTDIVSPLMLEKLKKINGPKVRNNQLVVLDTKNYDSSKLGGHEADPIWYLPQDQRDEARISPTNSTLFPHRIDVAVLEGNSAQTTLGRGQVESLQFSDWVAVFRDPETINPEFLENAAKCILNPGCIYTHDDKVWLFSRRARALRGSSSIKLDDSLFSLWEEKKRITLKRYPCIGELTLMQRLVLRLQHAWHRGAFLFPAFVSSAAHVAFQRRAPRHQSWRYKMNLRPQSESPAKALPSISIVVPNFNGGATIEATLVSLIEQNYPGLEILVVDGGSTDNSVEVIRRYESHIGWWVSEKDRGQSDAINKGFARAKGEIVNWLCSDDVLMPGALHAVGRSFVEAPLPDLVVGACQFTYLGDSAKDHLEIPTAPMLEVMPCANLIPQPSCFFRRSLLDRDAFLDVDLHYLMDFELWNYVRQRGAKWKFIPDVLSTMYFNGQNKTSTGRVKITREWEAIYKRYVYERIPLTYWHRRLRYPLERVRRRHRGLLFAYLVYFPYQCAIIALLSPFYGFRRVRWMNWVEYG